MTDAAKDLIKLIRGMSGKYSGYEIFSDWVKLSALSVCNSCHCLHGKIWKEREQAYLDTARKYSPDELQEFCRMLGLLAMALDEDLSDVLGEVYMQAGLSSKQTGQFFTPFHLSELCAQLAVLPGSENPESTEPIFLHEPSSGAGGMIIAAAKVLKERGVDFQRRLRVIAQDLDWKGVYMTYLQLSLIGIRAKVVQGDTLQHPYDPNTTDPANVMITPAEMIGGLP